MYDTILFDLDDTLIDFQASQLRSLKRLHAEFYADIDYILFEDAYRPINRALWDRVGSIENPVTPNEIKAIRFIQIHKQLNINRDDHVLISETYEHFLGEAADWMPNAKPVIELLHQKGHRMGIITNGLYALQLRKYTLLELDKWFHGFTVSETAGVAKPHKQIFDLALSDITEKQNRESVLMVGDSLHHDGYGAKNAGIPFCFVNSHSVPAIPTDLPVKYHIASVAELPRVLGY